MLAKAKRHPIALDMDPQGHLTLACGIKNNNASELNMAAFFEQKVPLAKLLRDTGLAAGSAHVRWERLRDEPDAVVEYCRTLGCGHVAVPVLPPEYRNAQGYARFGAEAAELAGRLHASGVQISYHNHSFELERFGSASGLELLFRASAPGLGAQVDLSLIHI